MLLALLLAGGIAAQAQPEISVKPVPGKGYQATVTPFPVDDLETIYDRLKLVAKGQCGKLTVRWGRFKYNTITEGNVRKHIDFEQGFSCIDPATDPYKPVPAGWKATPQDDADALDFARRYMAVIDAVDVTRGLKMMEPILELDGATWRTQPDLLKSRGTGSRSYRGPYWEANPDTASHPGAYATIIFRGSYSAMASHCGYLVIYREAPGRYLVSQQSMVVYDKAIVASGAVSAANAAKACEGY